MALVQVPFGVVPSIAKMELGDEHLLVALDVLADPTGTSADVLEWSLILLELVYGHVSFSPCTRDSAKGSGSSKAEKTSNFYTSVRYSLSTGVSLYAESWCSSGSQQYVSHSSSARRNSHLSASCHG